MIQQWMISVTTQQLDQFLPTITVTEAEMTTYLVLKKDKKDKKKPEVAPKPSPMDTTSPGASQPEEREMKVCLYTCIRENIVHLEREKERSVIFPSQWKKRWFVQDLPVHLRIERERERRESLSGFCVKRSEFSSLSKSTLMSILFGSRWR